MMIVEGRNPVFEIIENNPDVVIKVFIKESIESKWKNKIYQLAQSKNIDVELVDSSTLNKISKGNNDQGVVAKIKDFVYAEHEDIINRSKDMNMKPLFILLDGIQDPHNLGSIIRTASAAGVSGVVIPKRRACQVNSTVIKTSAGTATKIPIVRVSNINNYIDKLKKEGVFCFALDVKGEDIYNTDFDKSVALVVGSEGDGVSRLTKEKCDGLISIPIDKSVESLNAGVAAGVSIFEVIKQRKVKDNYK